MKASTIRKIIAAIMVMSLFIVALIIPANAEDAATEKVHVLESKDLAAIAQGAKADGDTEKGVGEELPVGLLHASGNKGNIGAA